MFSLPTSKTTDLYRRIDPGLVGGVIEAGEDERLSL